QGNSSGDCGRWVPAFAGMTGFFAQGHGGASCMYDAYGGSFGRFFAALVPFGMALLGSLLANFPISFTGGFLPAPLFGLMPVYFFGLMRPDLMPVGAALLAGVFEDLLS